MEDFLLTKAFIAASKDPIKGADQKGHVFMGTMVESYKILTAEQMRLDVTRLRDNQMLTSRAAVQAGTGNALQDLCGCQYGYYLSSPHCYRSLPSALQKDDRSCRDIVRWHRKPVYYQRDWRELQSLV
jgi:hypothetical protein